MDQGYAKACVLVEFRSEADKEYEELFAKYAVVICNTDEFLKKIEEKKGQEKSMNKLSSKRRMYGGHYCRSPCERSSV